MALAIVGERKTGVQFEGAIEGGDGLLVLGPNNLQTTEANVRERVAIVQRNGF